MAQLVEIKTSKVGQAFGCCASVRAGGRLLHETEPYPFNHTSAAFSAAEEWADRNGYLTPRGADALANARTEYSRTMDAAARHPAADGRRVLSESHCLLASAIQAFERNLGFENLEKATAECKRVREMWTQGK